MSDLQGVIQLAKDDFIIVNDETHVRVVVGSSIALAIYDPAIKIMGVCHFSSPVKGQVLTSSMVKELKEKGLNKPHAVIFGGASLSKNKSFTQKIGTRNYEFAKYFLSFNKIALYRESFGGSACKTVVLGFTEGEEVPLITEKVHLDEE